MSATPAFRNDRPINALCLALAAALFAALAAFSAWLWQAGRAPLLLAPALGGLHNCLALGPRGAPADAACTAPDGSAAPRIERALQALGPRESADGRFLLGYTLVVPLLNLFEPHAQAAPAPEGRWAVNEEALRRIARTIEGVPRPVVLYLFSTHFSEEAPIEAALAQNPDNMAATPAGPLPPDRYMGWPLYPWSIARTDNPITRRREQAIRALADALCQMPPAARARIAGINLLGEVHHLYPDFEAGMGAGSDYVITDYSAASRQGFSRWLARRFAGDIGALNAWLGGAPFASFDDVQPPSRDIRRQPLAHYWQHLDATAHGLLPVSGWAHAASGPAWVRVYLNGRFAARVPARFMRQDVAAARPDLGTAQVGWRYDLPFARLPAGLYRIDLALEDGPRLIHMGARHVAVMDRQQSTPRPQPMQAALPPMQPAGGSGAAYWIDTPQDHAAVFYNPLAALWHVWRAEQVVAYLRHFDALLERTCLAGVPRRTQQIYPAEKAGWDGTRFASEASLKPFGHVQLGINLYGEATQDDSFFDWLARSRQGRYSVTEFHPMHAMSAAELRRVLLRHQAHGAQTLSFFLHPPEPARQAGQGAQAAQPNPFAFDPANPLHGSDALYRAVQGVMGKTGRPDRPQNMP